jgi:hypothetical protein
VFNSPDSPAAFVDSFRRYYGPTMNAFEAAEKGGRAEDLRKELEDLFTKQNTGKSGLSIPRHSFRVTSIAEANDTIGDWLTGSKFRRRRLRRAKRIIRKVFALR